MTAHYVYRCYEADGRLAYIGATRDLIGRLTHHRAVSWWSGNVVRATAKVYPTKEAARLVETRAIRAERPRWNVMCQYPDATWPRDCWDDYITAYIRAARTTDCRRRSLEKLTVRYTQLFGEAPIERAA